MVGGGGGGGGGGRQYIFVLENYVNKNIGSHIKIST